MLHPSFQLIAPYATTITIGLMQLLTIRRPISHWPEHMQQLTVQAVTPQVMPGHQWNVKAAIRLNTIPRSLQTTRQPESQSIVKLVIQQRLGSLHRLNTVQPDLL